MNGSVVGVWRLLTIVFGIMQEKLHSANCRAGQLQASAKRKRSAINDENVPPVTPAAGLKRRRSMHTTAAKSTPAWKQAMRRRVEALLPALDEIKAQDHAAFGHIIAKAARKFCGDDAEAWEAARAAMAEESGATLTTMQQAAKIMQDRWDTCSIRVS